MPKAPRGRAPAQPVSRDELEAVAREALASGSGIKRTQLKKALPKSYAAAHGTVLDILRELADQEKIHRWKKGSKEVFFACDPIGKLDELVAELVKDRPVDANALKTAIQQDAPGHEDLFTEWLKSALTRGIVFVQAPIPGSKAKRYGREPDFRGLLKRELTGLRKAIERFDTHRNFREKIAEVLLAELGLPESRARSAASNGARSDAPIHSNQFMTALTQLAEENPKGALLSVSELRMRARMTKADFDNTALRLRQEGAISLHYHDHPHSLNENDRIALVQDGRGEYYVGIALRRQP